MVPIRSLRIKIEIMVGAVTKDLVGLTVPDSDSLLLVTGAAVGDTGSLTGDTESLNSEHG